MDAYLTAKQKALNEERRWRWVIDKIQAEMATVQRRYPTSFRVALLREMVNAAEQRDGSLLVTLGRVYLKKRRILPPGIYGSCPPPGKTFYLDTEPLEPGRKVATLELGVIHAQIYR